MSTTIVPGKNVTTYTVSDLAARFRVGVRTIHRWARNGTLPPPLGFSHFLRWDAANFEDWYKALVEGGPDHAS